MASLADLITAPASRRGAAAQNALEAARERMVGAGREEVAA